MDNSLEYCLLLLNYGICAEEPGYQRNLQMPYLTMTGREIEDHELALLRWNDEAMNGRLFCKLRKFRHPQLGDVEIGGWEPSSACKTLCGTYRKKECREEWFVLPGYGFNGPSTCS